MKSPKNLKGMSFKYFGYFEPLDDIQGSVVVILEAETGFYYILYPQATLVHT